MDQFYRTSGIGGFGSSIGGGFKANVDSEEDEEEEKEFDRDEDY